MSWHKQKERWDVRIGFRGKYYYLGYFDNDMDAAFQYDLKALELFGEFAKLNFDGPSRLMYEQGMRAMR